MLRLKASKVTLKKMKDFLESEQFSENQTLENILEKIAVDYDDYEDALKISERGKQIVLRRRPNECFINNYNKHFIKAYQANMDLQFCFDPYAVVTYVCDYWMKDESGMTDFLKEAFKEAKSWENRALLSYLKRTYMSKRQLGKCEAVYRAIPSMKLQGSNIACTFVQSGYPNNQSKFLRKVQPCGEVQNPSAEDSITKSESDDD